MSELLPSVDKLTKELLTEFSGIQLIAADLDGTLIQTNNPEIWNNVLLLMRALRTPKHKMEIIIATGRTLAGAKRTIENLYTHKNLPIILYNGSVVVRYGDYGVLYKKIIPNAVLNRIQLEIQTYKVSILAYYYLDATEALFGEGSINEYVLGWTKYDRHEVEFNNMQVNWTATQRHLDFHPSAVLINVVRESPDKVKEIIEKLRNIGDITVTSSGFSYIEIRPLESDKAKALEFVSNLLGIERKAILSIGDNDNDSEMLDWAGIGVSIGHSTALAKEKSKYQCTHDVGSGVLEVLRIIKAAKRYINHYAKNS